MFNIVRDKKVIIISAVLIVCFLISFLLLNNTSNVHAEEGTNLEVLEDSVVEGRAEETLLKFDIKGYVVNPGVYEFSAGECINDAIKKAGGLTKDADTSIINLSRKLNDEDIIRVYSKKEVSKYKSVINTTPEDITDSLKGRIKSSIDSLFERKLDDKALMVKKNALIESYSREAEEKYSEINNIKLELSGSYIIDNKIKSEEDTNKDDNNIDSNNLININTASKDELMTLEGVGEARALDIIKYRESNKFRDISEIQNISGIGEASYKKIQNNITI